jgi:SAM-dependent methyltransferase
MAASDDLISRLISPESGLPLSVAGDSLVDARGNRYGRAGGAWDLRPVQPPVRRFEWQPRPIEEIRQFDFEARMRPSYSHPDVRTNDVKEENVIGFLPRSCTSGAICLDHGCGAGRLRRVIEALGYRYCGVDSETGGTAEQGGGSTFVGGAGYLADLHYLPFADETFDCAVSYSVFEHLQNPFVGAGELLRVLKPGGTAFLGIASLIPFHMDSMFHHTYFGVYSLFRSAGFEVLRVGAADWNGFPAIASMDGLPGPSWLRRMLIAPVVGAHLALWSLRAKLRGRQRDADDRRRRLMMAGIVKALVRRPAIRTGSQGLRSSG